MRRNRNAGLLRTGFLNETATSCINDDKMTWVERVTNYIQRIVLIYILKSMDNTFFFVTWDYIHRIR